MKIGINGFQLLEKAQAGPEVYAKNLVLALSKVDTTNDYVIYLPTKPDVEEFRKQTSINSRFSYKILNKLPLWSQLGLSWELLRNPVDVFFSPTHTIPGLVSILTLGRFNPIVMIHGLEFKVNNQFGQMPIHRFLHPFVLWWISHVSKKIIVPSKATRNAIQETPYMKVSDEKIVIVPEGVLDLYKKVSDEEVKLVKEKYDLGTFPYLFSLSTIQPRKNYPKLIQAFSEALKSNYDLKDFKLVIAGKNGWEYEESLSAPKEYGIEDNVVFLGWVPTEDHPPLFSGSKAFVSASLEEGFGLPLLEAMSCETQCLVSNISAYKELGVDTISYFDPHDESDIKEKLLSVMAKEIDTDMVEKAHTRSRNYTWEQTAKKVLEVFTSFA